MEFLKSQWTPLKAPRVVAELRFKVVTSAVKSLERQRDDFRAGRSLLLVRYFEIGRFLHLESEIRIVQFQIFKTNEPRTCPVRKRSSASLASASGNVSKKVCTGTSGAILMKSSASFLVRLATEHKLRSPQSSS